MVDPRFPSKPTPSVTASTTVPVPPKDDPADTRVASVLLAEDGQGGPNYTVNGNVLTSWGKLVDANGQPIANATLISRAVRGGQPAEELGRTTTGADGSFRFDATLPADHGDENFAASLIYEGDAEHKPTSLTTNPKAAAPTGNGDQVAPSDGGGNSSGTDSSETGDTGTSESTDTGTSEGPVADPVSVTAPTRLPSTGASDLVVPGVLGALALAGGCALLLTRRRN